MIDPPKAKADPGTPRADAFYMPADYCRQARLWLPWPDGNPDLQDAIAAIAREVAAFEPVTLLVNPGAEYTAHAKCGAFVTDIIVLPHTSARLRDTGPTFLVDGKGGSAAVDWRFNGWGSRRDIPDTELAHALLGTAKVRRFRAPLTLEGSSIVADGRGTLLALASAVFDPARNAALAPLEAFGIFQQWLGADRVVWLADAHPGDALNTDVRLVASFIAAGVVAVTAGSSACEHLRRVHDAQGPQSRTHRTPGTAARRHTAVVLHDFPADKRRTAGAVLRCRDRPARRRYSRRCFSGPRRGARSRRCLGRDGGVAHQFSFAASGTLVGTRPRDCAAAFGMVAARARCRSRFAKIYRYGQRRPLSGVVKAPRRAYLQAR